jgi:hypothetical protein
VFKGAKNILNDTPQAMFMNMSITDPEDDLGTLTKNTIENMSCGVSFRRFLRSLITNLGLFLFNFPTLNSFVEYETLFQ